MGLKPHQIFGELVYGDLHSTATLHPEAIMAILLRNTQTGFFYVGYNRWRVYPEEAFDFQTLERANQWIESTHLDDVEIVYVPNPAALNGQRQPSANVNGHNRQQK